MNGARLLGPAIGGLVISAVGEGYCFLADGISYIAVIASLLMMHVGNVTPRRSQKRVRQELAEGWRYVIESRPIRSILVMLAMVGLIGMPYTVLMPIMVGNVLHSGPHTLGFLMGAAGVGALISALSLAVRKTVLGLGRMIAISAAMFGAGLILFGLSKHFWISLPLMLLTGFGMMQQLAASNTILQTIVADDKRGRVMSFYTLAVLGITPIGSLLAGALASRIGAPATLIAGGSICACAAAWFARELPRIRPLIRPIYRELGILPQVAAGLQSASALQAPPEQ